VPGLNIYSILSCGYYIQQPNSINASYVLQTERNGRVASLSNNLRTNEEKADTGMVDSGDNSCFVPLSEIINVPTRLQWNLEKRKMESTSFPVRLHNKGACSPTGQVKVETIHKADCGRALGKRIYFCQIH
jgi:hypothetical protein